MEREDLSTLKGREDLLFRTGVWRRGHFVLNDGRHTSVHYSLSGVKDEQHVTRIAEWVADAVTDLRFDGIVALSDGEQRVALMLAKFLGVHEDRVLMGRRDKVTGRASLDPEFASEVSGGKFIIFSCRITRGETARQLADDIRHHGGEPIGVVVLVNRAPREGEGVITTEKLGVPHFVALHHVAGTFEQGGKGKCMGCDSGSSIDQEVGDGAAYVKQHGQPRLFV